MADYGFGTGDFGFCPFGHADLTKSALWELTIPQRNKDDDALVGGDLEDFLEAVGEMVDDALIRARDFPLQGDPVTALSGSENRINVGYLSADIIPDGQIRVTINESDRALVEKVFPRSVESDGTPRQDGWLAVITGEFYRITRVRAHDTEAVPYGSPTIDIKTNIPLEGTLTLQPPDLLTLLGSNVGVLVDKADPTDYTRRNILRHRLLRDLKVSERLFKTLGLLTGFDVKASGLYCISEEWYNSIRLSAPNHTFVFEGKFFTDLVLSGHRFDEVPADVMPLDTFGDVDVAVIDVSDPVEESENLWCVKVKPVDRALLAGRVGFWQLVDAPDPLVDSGFQAFSSHQNFTVPEGVTQITVAMVGGGGSGPLNGTSTIAATNGTGGAGGFVRATIDVTPGETLYAIVGEGGHDSSDYLGGSPGGGQAATVGIGRDTGGAGGGYSAISRGASHLIIAGGGGGAGWSVTGSANAAGGAGGNTPEDGVSTGAVGNAGLAASLISGGLGGTGVGSNGNSGSSFTGAPGFVGLGAYDGGGGGGGGWYGGGSGAADVDGAGGGGGSSYASDVTAVSVSYLDGAGPTPGGISEPEYQVGSGEGGGPGQAGADGFVYVSWASVPNVAGEGTGRYIENVKVENHSNEDTLVNTDGTTGPFIVTTSNDPIKPGTVTIKWSTSLLVDAVASDDGNGGLLGDATGTVDYNTGIITFTPSAATDNPGSIFVTYSTVRVCVYSLTAPNIGSGKIRIIARRVCRSDYKKAAAYRIVATPDKVLTEPGVDFSRLVDRMEQKLDKYVPIHIRMLVKLFKQKAVASTWIVGGPDLDAQDTITDYPEVNVISGARFDVIPADVQPLDDGVFLLTAQFTEI